MITYNVPIKKPRARKITLQARQGMPLTLTLASGRALACVIQCDDAGKLTDTLVHLASGHRIGNLGDIRTEIACRLTPGHAAALSRKALAPLLLAKIEARVGSAKVAETIDAAPVINP